MTRKRWIGLAVGLAVIVGAVWGLRASTRAAPAPVAASGDPANAGVNRAIPVISGTVEQRDMPMYLDGLGSVIASSTVTVKSRVDGQLVKVHFTEGQEVRQGDLLAQIDPRSFEIQVRQASAALARDQAQLTQARLTLSRNRALRQENLISQDAVDQQNANVTQLEATIRSGQSAVDNAKLQLSSTRITSPLNGRTGLRLIDAGNMIHANDPNGLVVIAQLDPVAVLITLPEDHLVTISEQMALHPLIAEAYSRDGTVKLGTGRVDLMDNQINATAGTIKLKASFSNSKRTLWPNQFVKVRVLVSTSQNAVVVPASVIQRGPNGSFAYVIRKDKTVDARPIEVGPIEGDTALIRTGLNPGELVVIDGQSKLRNGVRVSFKPVDKSNQGGAQQGPSAGADAAGAPP